MNKTGLAASPDAELARRAKISAARLFKMATVGHLNDAAARERMAKAKRRQLPNGFSRKPGYAAVHAWMTRAYGQPQQCERCARTDGRFHWSNNDGAYLRDRANWERLCVSCHRKHDYVLGKET